MSTLKRILGKKGRTTIPYEFRKILDLKHNDVLTFAMNDDCNCVIITKERICTDCIRFLPQEKEVSLDEMLSGLNREEMIQTIAAISKALIDKEDLDAVKDLPD